MQEHPRIEKKLPPKAGSKPSKQDKHTRRYSFEFKLKAVKLMRRGAAAKRVGLWPRRQG